MNRAAFGLVLGVIALASGAFLFSGTDNAAAEVTGDCDATFAGIDVSELDSGSTDDAIVVSEDDIVEVTFTSNAGFESHEVTVEFADIPGGSVEVEDEDDGGDTSWTGEVVIDDWAWAGAGLYRVEGTAVLGDGSECSGAALIDVDKPFYETLAGIVALVLTLFGAASVGMAGVSSVLDGRKAMKKVDDWAIDELEKVSAGQPYTPPDRQSVIGDAIDYLCVFAIVPGLLLTAAAMAGGRAPAGGLGLPRANWRPRLSVSGIIGGILGGIGVVGVLQQSGQVFPDETTIGLWIAIGLLLGVVLPSLIRALNVISLNRAISRAEKRLLEAGATPHPAAPPPEQPMTE